MIILKNIDAHAAMMFPRPRATWVISLGPSRGHVAFPPLAVNSKIVFCIPLRQFFEKHRAPASPGSPLEGLERSRSQTASPAIEKEQMTSETVT